MKPGFFHIVGRSILFNKRSFFQLALVILVLSAVITGSLLTGDSVRNSLRYSSFRKLGNTGIVISSGLRYFDPSLTGRMLTKTGLPAAGLLEISGSCQNFETGQSTQNVKILAVDHDFFNFHGNDTIKPGKGEAAVNEKLAGYLGLKQGDDIVIHFSPVSEVPSNAPFSPETGAGRSVALKIRYILSPEQSGNFSLNISQIDPLNIFVNRSDITDSNGAAREINRMLLQYGSALTSQKVYSDLKEILTPEDIGLDLNYINKKNCYEIISGRIFIDKQLIDEIRKALPMAYPLVTYLGNSFRFKDRTTPYSFISALPPELYPGIPAGNGIIINQWLMDDLGAKRGDTIRVNWYSADALNHLVEKDTSFIISSIGADNGPLADSLLMPLFPGIAGRESCTGWDAGKYVNTELIRKKDEDYWNRYRGTPKAFINYETGRRLWGNNFGPATALRFPSDITEEQIRSGLRGKIDPGLSGFVITDLRNESARAAREGVDFSTLFISLGFFMIISSVLLLLLVISSYYDSKREEVAAYFALGFTDRWIENFILADSLVMALTGALAGAFSGWIFNLLIIKALNSVWLGAVQTTALDPHFNILLILAGFIITVVVVVVILILRSRLFMRKFHVKKAGELKKASKRVNLRFLMISGILTVVCELCSLLMTDHAVIFAFISGVFLFITLILLWRQLYIGSPKIRTGLLKTKDQLTSRYYTFSSSQAITPVIFIAAGLFAVVITSINRLSISESNLGRKGGTGGFVLWGETGIPVKDDLNSIAVRRVEGIDDPEFSSVKFVQCLKSPGNDASCLNLNHITAPPLLGIDASELIERDAFSFAAHLRTSGIDNPWKLLDLRPVGNSIYGVADQTVLEYGLKLKIGDTLKIRSETGQALNIVIAAGLKSSVFQGYVVVGRENMSRYYPSVPGSQIFLGDGDPKNLEFYNTTLNNRLSPYNAHFESAADRLASFFIVTNTYLSVFTALGGIGMILGIIGLGIIVLRNFSQRKQEYAVMMATGFSVGEIRSMIFSDQLKILLSGIITGFASAIVATLPSLDLNSGIPWKTLLLMLLMLILVGAASSFIALRSVTRESLVSAIRGR